MLLLLLKLSMTAMLSGRWARSHGGMGSICWAGFLLFDMAATASTTTVASFTKTVPNSFTLSVGWVMMHGDFDIPIFPGRSRGGRGRA